MTNCDVWKRVLKLTLLKNTGTQMTRIEQISIGFIL